ncbi:MAG: DUF4292 domain-containing protein [Alloprevotella sp.]|nr:DUF4292 domain-containing protein [Alloprevotella sp.]
MHPLRYLTLFILTLALASCGSKKSLPAPDYSTLSGYEAIEASYRQWQRLRVPVTLSISSPKQMSISGVATMVRDSSINISLRMLGLEVAVMDITPDSITLAEKMNKQYLSIPIADAIGRYGFTPANLQDLLTGRVFLLGASTLTPAMATDFTVITDTGLPQWLLKPKSQPKEASYIFAIRPDNTLSAITITPTGREPMGIPYTASEATAAGVFATDLHVVIPTKKAEVVAGIQWNWSKATFDSQVTVKPFTLGKGYRRLDIDQLLKQLPAAQ